MTAFDAQSIEIGIPYARAFELIADPLTLPEWTHAFASVSGGRAVMRTPAGTATVDLVVTSSREDGVIDWKMTFGDGQVARAWSRLVPHRDRTGDLQLRAAGPAGAARGPRGNARGAIEGVGERAGDAGAPAGATRRDGDMTEVSLEALVEDARAGNRRALNALVERVQQPIHTLAVRMLWHPEDARDATQEDPGPHCHPSWNVPRGEPVHDVGVPSRRELSAHVPSEPNRGAGLHLRAIRQRAGRRSSPRFRSATNGPLIG